jgi:hypothetical protein
MSMNVFKACASAAAAGALMLASGCAMTGSDTHRHGPRGDRMQNSAMPAPATDCPYEGQSHDMHRPRDTGRMLTAAHPGCQADAEESQSQSEAAPSPQPQ